MTGWSHSYRLFRKAFLKKGLSKRRVMWIPGKYKCKVPEIRA